MVSHRAMDMPPPRRITTVAERNSKDERLLLGVIDVRDPDRWNRRKGDRNHPDFVDLHVGEVYPARTNRSDPATLIS
tara:strand:+ start:106 stop:336 length:231 start_codon:yes stop_codon:yes gene_type:complete